MNLNINIPWSELKEKIKEADATISDEDLVFKKGHEKEFLERLAGKMKKDITDVKAWVESIAFNKGKAS
jgi:hypothetical protein